MAILNYVQKTNIKFIETMKKLHDNHEMQAYQMRATPSIKMYATLWQSVKANEFVALELLQKKKNGVCLLEGD